MNALKTFMRRACRRFKRDRDWACLALDVDLLLEINKALAEPAQLAARFAARVSRAMYGPKVDVLIKAPNLLHLPIPSIALSEGVRL